MPLNHRRKYRNSVQGFIGATATVIGGLTAFAGLRHHDWAATSTVLLGYAFVVWVATGPSLEICDEGVRVRNALPLRRKESSPLWRREGLRQRFIPWPSIAWFSTNTISGYGYEGPGALLTLTDGNVIKLDALHPSPIALPWTRADWTRRTVGQLQEELQARVPAPGSTLEVPHRRENAEALRRVHHLFDDLPPLEAGDSLDAH